MKRRNIHFCLFLVTMLALPLARAGDHPIRIWILPFDNPGAEASLEYLQEGLPGLLAVALSQSDQHAVVDRRHLNQVLAEQSLSLAGLTAQPARREIGKLLGATVMISGSFAKQGPDLLITARAYDVATGRVAATAESRGAADRLGRLVRELYRKLAHGLGNRLPDLHAEQIDTAPLSNLHFMRGLGYYFSARYNQALAEFMQAGRVESLSDLARLWLANSYLAEAQYDHAYLELSRLTRGASRQVWAAGIEAKLRVCEKHLAAEEMNLIQELAARQDPAEQ